MVDDENFIIDVILLDKIIYEQKYDE